MAVAAVPMQRVRLARCPLVQEQANFCGRERFLPEFPQCFCANASSSSHTGRELLLLG